MSSSSTVKSRHYQALSNRVKHLQANLRETEVAMELMAERLQDMARLGINHGSQFMAASRVLEAEVRDCNRRVNDEEPESAAEKA